MKIEEIQHIQMQINVMKEHYKECTDHDKKEKNICIDECSSTWFT